VAEGELTAAMANLTRIRLWLALFVCGLVASGMTAFPLLRETETLVACLHGPAAPLALMWPEAAAWVERVHAALAEVHARYPFLAYGTDWLGFAHLVIALAFWGPWRDPVRNVWVIEWGMIACGLVIPTALICGPLRGIPLFWRAIDCSFGVLGVIPLWRARRLLRRSMPP
jgi:hypothetical protein